MCVDPCPWVRVARCFSVICGVGGFVKFRLKLRVALLQ